MIIGTFELKEEGISLFKPELGNVAFGSGRLNWAFSCLTFAKLYANKFGIDCKRLQEKLWGDNYFDLE
jgi:elongation factor 2